MDSREQPRKHEKTDVYCPECGGRTHVGIHHGHAWVYCHHCRKEVEVLVRANK